jgi:hypothetical protein
VGYRVGEADDGSRWMIVFRAEDSNTHRKSYNRVDVLLTNEPGADTTRWTS